MGRAEGAKIQWLFPCLLISFCAIYLIYYPPSYGIEDEGNILQLSYSLSHGTIFPDRAGPYPGPSIDGHRVSKFSGLSRGDDCSAVEVRLAARVWSGGVIFRGRRFIVRNWLTRENLNADWSALYFLCRIAHYTQTLLAGLPAAVAALFGVSLLLRE